MAARGGLSGKKWAALLDRLATEDFDGHTEFARLTPEQRLAWLSGCAQFWYEARGNRFPGDDENGEKSRAGEKRRARRKMKKETK
jgi:hypothetical protein